MKVAQFYNSISPVYYIIDFFLSSHKKHLIREVNGFNNSSILEIGIGLGKYLKQYNSTDITAIDISEKMLTRAKKNNPDNVRFVQLNATELSELQRSFDVVVLSHVLSTGTKANEIIESAQKVLNPHGKLVILNHFSSKDGLGALEKFFQPFAKLFHFNSYFLLENLTALNEFRQMKALKFGVLNRFQLLVFEKT